MVDALGELPISSQMLSNEGSFLARAALTRLSSKPCAAASLAVTWPMGFYGGSPGWMTAQWAKRLREPATLL